MTLLVHVLYMSSYKTAASKKVQYDTTGKVIAEFESASEAARRIGKPHRRSSICKW